VTPAISGARIPNPADSINLDAESSPTREVHQGTPVVAPSKVFSRYRSASIAWVTLSRLKSANVYPEAPEAA
jgi:hypothetical protein